MGLRSFVHSLTRPSVPIGGTRQISGAENRRMLRARFDSQFTTDDNRRRWQLIDAMSVDASANWMVRRTLRMRSRYCYHNNSWCQGIIHTLANYIIGIGPILQMRTKNKTLNALIEKRFTEWAKEVRFAQVLWSMCAARKYNGESFALMRTNPKLLSPIKLDIFEVEADQVTSPLFGMYPSQYPDQFFDGVMLDPWGNPETYHVLRQHPGAFGAFALLGTEFDPWPARYVLHSFKRIRPGQQRGIPEILPALEPFEKLRAYSAAVLDCAETAARYPVVIETDAPAEGADETQFTKPDTYDLQTRAATVLPDGYKLSQMKAEQPTTTYDGYTVSMLCEIVRCLNMPLFMAMMDAQKANMSSAYVVSQPFAKSVEVERGDYNDISDRIFDEFLTEGLRIPGFLPADTPSEFPHSWRWPRINNHADPAKVATGHQMSLESGTTSIPMICAEDGRDPDEVKETNARYYGMTVPEYEAALRQKAFAIRGNPAPATTDPEPANLPVSDRWSGDDEAGDGDE